MTAPDVRTAGCNRPLTETTNSSIIGHPDTERKAVATLAARLAFMGFSLHELACGGFLIARWDRTAHCSDLHAVAAFLRRVEGQQ